MNSLVAQMMGKKVVREDVPVPVGMPRTDGSRGRDRRSVQRRGAAAAMLGMAEAEDDDEQSLIPDDAEELQNINGPSGIRMDDEELKKDREAQEPDHPSEIPSASDEDRLLSPRDALVAPDVTPQAMEPIDASEVPAAKQQGQVPRFVPPRYTTPAANGIDPMDVLLGRNNPQRTNKPELPPENVVTAESAQATVNTLLNAGGGAGGTALLKPKQPMPDPTPGDAGKIMEAFDKYGPARSWNF